MAYCPRFPLPCSEHTDSSDGRRALAFSCFLTPIQVIYAEAIVLLGHWNILWHSQAARPGNRNEISSVICQSLLLISPLLGTSLSHPLSQPCFLSLHMRMRGNGRPRILAFTSVQAILQHWEVQVPSPQEGTSGTVWVEGFIYDLVHDGQQRSHNNNNKMPVKGNRWPGCGEGWAAFRSLLGLCLGWLPRKPSRSHLGVIFSA